MRVVHCPVNTAGVPWTNVQALRRRGVEAQLVDYYVGEWIDRLDELKTNIDERQVLANTGAFALGRKTDEIGIPTRLVMMHFEASETEEPEPNGGSRKRRKR